MICGWWEYRQVLFSFLKLLHNRKSTMIISKWKSEKGKDFLGQWELVRGTTFLDAPSARENALGLWVICTVSHKALHTGGNLLLPWLKWLLQSTAQSVAFGSWTSGQLSERLLTQPYCDLKPATTLFLILSQIASDTDSYSVRELHTGSSIIWLLHRQDSTVGR